MFFCTFEGGGRCAEFPAAVLPSGSVSDRGRGQSVIPELISDIPVRPFHGRAARKAAVADEDRLLLMLRASSCADRESGKESDPEKTLLIVSFYREQ